MNAYSGLILLSLLVLTIPTFQTSDLRVEGSNPSARAGISHYWQHYLQLFLPLSFHSRSRIGVGMIKTLFFLE